MSYKEDLLETEYSVDDPYDTLGDFLASTAGDIVECSRVHCYETMHGQDAVWNNFYDLPYCSEEHKDLDEDQATSRQYQLEDLILEG